MRGKIRFMLSSYNLEISELALPKLIPETSTNNQSLLTVDLLAEMVLYFSVSKI